MVKVKVHHRFKDKYTDEVYEPGQIVDLTIKRMKEINENNKDKVEYVTRELDKYEERPLESEED